MKERKFDLKKRKFDLKERKFDLKKREFDLKKRKVDLKKRGFDLKKRKVDLKKREFDLKKQKVDLKKRISDLKKSKFDLERTDVASQIGNRDGKMPNLPLQIPNWMRISASQEFFVCPASIRDVSVSKQDDRKIG